MRGVLLCAVLVSAFGLGVRAEQSSGFVKTYNPLAKLRTAHTSPADPEDLIQVAQGRILYAEHCTACHGAALEGAEDWDEPEEDGSYRPPPHDDSGHTWHHSDKQLFDYVKLGGAELFKEYPDIVSNMPGFGDVLSDDDIWAIYAFIKTSWSDENREWQTMVSETDPLESEDHGSHE